MYFRLKRGKNLIMKKLVKPTVTVAVCALNEEKNIAAFLKSVLSQKERGFSIKKIIVISDGSSDKTVQVAKSFKSKKISVIEHAVRKGKSARLNEIYSDLDSDILFQSDSDVILSGPHVIQNLIKPMINDIHVAMCSGEAIPFKPTSLMEKAVSLTRETYLPLKKTLRGGNNKFSVNGRVLAYRKELVKKIKVPEQIIGNDAFTYFSCLSFGYSYRYVETAVVRFRSPRTLKDQIKQNTRFVAVPAKLESYFPKDLIRREYQIPLLIRAYYMVKQFIKHPLLATYIFIINRYCDVRAKMMMDKINGKWEIASSTKA